MSNLLVDILTVAAGAGCLWLVFRLENGGTQDREMIQEANPNESVEFSPPSPFKSFMSGAFKKCLLLLILFGIPYSFMSSLSRKPNFPVWETLGSGLVNLALLIYLIPIPFLFWGWRSQTKHSKSRLSWINNRLQAIRNQGLQGEQITHNALSSRSIKSILGEDHYLYEDKGALLLWPESKEGITQEVDHLLITQFGVFVIETKYWGGKLDRIGENDIHCHDHQNEPIKKNPLVQTQSKVKRIDEYLKGVAPVKALAVFASDETVLGDGDWTDMVLVKDLALWLSKTKAEYLASGKPILDVPTIKAALSDLVYTEPDAKHIHLLRIGEPEYLDLLEEKDRLEQSMPKMIWLWKKRSVNYFFVAECALMILALMTAKFFPEFVMRMFAPTEVIYSAPMNLDRPTKSLAHNNPPASPNPKPAPLWIPPPPPPITTGWSTPEQVARSQANAPVVNDLLNKATQCFYQKRYQCAYERAYEAFQIDPSNLMAAPLMRNAINEQNKLIAKPGLPVAQGQQ